LHALFASIMREVRDAGTWPPPTTFIARAMELGRARLLELREELPPPSEEVFTRESEELLHDLELFMKEECAQRGIEGIGFEVTFGTSDDDDEELGHEDPVVINLGRGKRIRLRGRIDRINRLQNGTYEIVDYKTGGFWRDDWTGVFAGGTRLQHALYGLAAAEVLRARVNKRAEVGRAAYRFPTSRGWRNRVEFTNAQARDVNRVLHELSDVLAAGAFIHAPHESGCKWCEFGPACGQAPVKRAKEKLDASANRVLEPYRRLRKHE
jgi:ATP-dependent helicase/nuclease subunit B